jgi:hypothetical protein
MKKQILLLYLTLLMCCLTNITVDLFIKFQVYSKKKLIIAFLRMQHQ